MVTPIQDPDTGRFRGSVGAGARDVPTAQSLPTRPTPSTRTDETPPETWDAAYQAYQHATTDAPPHPTTPEAPTCLDCHMRRCECAELDAERRRLARRTWAVRAATTVGIVGYATLAATIGPTSLLAFAGVVAAAAVALPFLRNARERRNNTQNNQNHPWIHDQLEPTRRAAEEISAAAGVRAPDIHYVPADDPRYDETGIASTSPGPGARHIKITHEFLQLPEHQQRAVLAHEIGHLRPSWPRAANRILATAAVPATLASAAIGIAGGPLLAAGAAATTLVSSFFAIQATSRAEEHRADRFAHNLEPHATIDTLSHLEQITAAPRTRSPLADLTESHPSIRNRLNTLTTKNPRKN